MCLFKGNGNLAKFQHLNVWNKTPLDSSRSNLQESGLNIIDNHIWSPVKYWNKPIIVLCPPIIIALIKIQYLSTHPLQLSLLIKLSLQLFECPPRLLLSLPLLPLDLSLLLLLTWLSLSAFGILFRWLLFFGSWWRRSLLSFRVYRRSLSLGLLERRYLLLQSFVDSYETWWLVLVNCLFRVQGCLEALVSQVTEV